MNTKNKTVTGGSNASHVSAAIMWLYRGYTIEYKYDGSSYPNCYEVRDTKDATNVYGGIWGTTTLIKAHKMVDELIDDEPRRNSRAYRKGEIPRGKY